MDDYLRSSFHSAILAGDVSTVERILELKPHTFDVNERLRDGNTALHISINLKRLAMVKLLLKYDANAHLKANEDEDTCLHLAVRSGDLELVDALLRHTDINGANKLRRTPLHLAVIANDYQLAKFLLSHGADVNAVAVDRETALHEAVKHRNHRLVELLLGHSANPNLQNFEGNSAFYESLRHNDAELLALFVNHGACLTLKNREYRNALHLAASGRAYPLLKQLIDLGMDVNARSEFTRRAPLHLALLSSERNDESLLLDVVQLLVRRHALPDIEDAEDKTPLYYAAERGHPRVVRYLLSLEGRVDPNHRCVPVFAAIRAGDATTLECFLDAGARINVKDYMGDGPLHVAVNLVEDASARFRLVNLLLDRGADIHEANINGSTVLHLAIRKRDDALFHLLMDRGASVAAVNSLSQTLLITACDSGMYQAARCLLELGSDANVLDVCGQTPLSLTVWHDDADLFVLLLKYGALVNDDKALEQAVSFGRDHMIRLLVSHGFDVDAYLRSAKGSKLFVKTVRASQARMVQHLLDLGCDVNRLEDGALPLKHAHDVWTRRELDSCLETMLVLVKRVAVLASSNLRVHEANWEVVRSSERLVDAFQGFSRELDVMKVTRILDDGPRASLLPWANVTYYDVLVMPRSELLSAIGCEAIDAALRSGDYKRSFVNYADELEIRYTNAVQFLTRRA